MKHVMLDKPIQVYDIEVYPNYMLVGFMDIKGRVRLYEAFDSSFTDMQISCIKRILKKYKPTGFNSKSYDDPILTYMLEGRDTSRVYKKSKSIIENNLNYWEVYKSLNIEKTFESIDLIDVAPSQASLKLYGARLNSKKLQDLPYTPETNLTKQQAYEVKKYNINDLQTTMDLYNKLIPMLELRKDIGNKYNINVMSKSDAQIAEAIFREELTKKGIKVKRGDKPDNVIYKAPKSVGFYREDLNDLVDRIEDTVIELNKAGSPLLPKWLKDEVITIGDTTYNIGLGGLHSQESKLVVIPKKDQVLCNVDVASYYPSLIIDLGLYPEQLTRTFLDVYSNIKATRLQAKKDAKDKSLSDKERAAAKVTDAVLKITLNGSYGKFGNRYSFLYSPNLLLTVTFTGQLYLLMLIEELEENGFKVVSSNTDGVEVLRKNHESDKLLLEDIVSDWETKTGMVMEYGQYNALFARDVNNYVAVYDGYAKAKGAYTDPKDNIPILSKNIEYPIVYEAIREYLANNTPMEETIYNEEDIARFTISTKVTGGAIFYSGELEDSDEYKNYIAKQLKKNKALEKRNDDYHKKQVLESKDSEYLGKVVRFYYSTNGKMILKSNGNKVPKADGVQPMMDLTDDIPKDLDYDKYIKLCYEHLYDLGVNIKN